MSEQIDLVREHVDDKHPLLDAEGCPVCEWMLEQHKQMEGNAA